MAGRDLEGGAVMRLGLSSAAAPDASLDELLGACARRGLEALELRAGDAHGVDREDALAALLAAECARAAGVTISGYRVAGSEDPLRLARLCEALGAPVLLADEGDIAQRVVSARRLAAAGADVVVVVRGAAVCRDADAIAALGLALAWDAEPAERPLGRDAETLLRDHGPRLQHIALFGGGPEAVMHEGRGVGELMGRLALAGYTGTLTLTPGARKYDVAWQTWLGRRGGWGCGSKTSDRTLVDLGSGA